MVHPNNVARYGARHTETQDAGSGSAVVLVAAPGVGKRLVIHDLKLSSDKITTFTLNTTEGGAVTRDFNLASSAPAFMFDWNLILDDNTGITFDTSAATTNTNISITTGEATVT